MGRGFEWMETGDLGIVERCREIAGSTGV